MSALGWQEVVVALAVIGALAYLVRRRLQRKGEGCEGCIQTAVEIRTAAQRVGPPLVQIELRKAGGNRPADRSPSKPRG